MVSPETPLLEIYVCLGTIPTPTLINLVLPLGSTLRQAVHASQLLDEKDISRYRFGIYGELKTLDTVLYDQDRVEIYTPLLIDPKNARASRVKQMRIKNPSEKRKWHASRKK